MCIAVILSAGCAYGVVLFDEPEAKPELLKNLVENDPRLPAYNNPVEVDLDSGQMHVSFKGVFRVNKERPRDEDKIAFMFVVIPREDMALNVSTSAVFDGGGHKFDDDYWWRKKGSWIGGEQTQKREIIAGVPTMVAWYLNASEKVAGSLPTIARVSFTFNSQEIQYRNIKTREWSAWEKLQQELGL